MATAHLKRSVRPPKLIEALNRELINSFDMVALKLASPSTWVSPNHPQFTSHRSRFSALFLSAIGTCRLISAKELEIVHFRVTQLGVVEGAQPARVPSVVIVCRQRYISVRRPLIAKELPATQRKLGIQGAYVRDDRRCCSLLRFQLALLAALFLSDARGAWSQVSRLNIGTATAQTLVENALFTKQSRWYLVDQGDCYYAYLEYPKVHLGEGRVYLGAHLSARLGTEVLGACVGPGLASDVTLSGRAVGSGSTLTLDDVRIDRVADPNTAAAIGILQQAAPQALPHAFSIDVLKAARGNPVSAAGIAISVADFKIGTISTSASGLSVDFVFALTSP